MSKSIYPLCKHCKKEFTPKPNFRNYCSTACKNPINRPGNVSWNKGMVGRQIWMNLTGLEEGRKPYKDIDPERCKAQSEIMKENNPYHKMSDEWKTNFAKKGSIAGNKKMEENPELYAEKKRKKMNILIDNGYRPQDNDGWKGGYREAPIQTKEEFNLISKKIGEHLGI